MARITPESSPRQCHHPPPIQGRRTGFTLVELLVVIAIVALLAGLLITVLPRVLSTSHAAECLSNIRQIGMALQLYVNEHDGSLPPTRHSAAAEEAWIFLLSPYLANVDEVRISPADPKGAERLDRGGTSYILNDLIFDRRVDPFGQPLPGGITNIRQIERPGSTLLAAIISDNRGTGATNDHAHATHWTSRHGVLADVEVDRHRIGSRHPDRTQGKAHYLYGDGSIRTIQAADLLSVVDEGVNIGEPGQAP